MKLSKSIRYRPYKDWSQTQYNDIKKRVAQSPWHTTYHLEPKTGLLNDPNGFSYFNGKFQLFYQNWPFGAAHGLKQWVHTESTDLVHFNETGITLQPDHPYDSHGAYSGSAYEINNQLFLFYTGNVRDKNWIRTPLQIGAWMDKQGHIKKEKHVLIQPEKDVTEHFRDPQIFNYHKQLYAIIGAQNLKNKGFIKLYKAENNDVNHWQFVGNLDFGVTGTEYMIECPNLVFIDEHPVLLYCPQGLDKKELNYDNIFPNTYKIYQTFDTNKAKLIGTSNIQNLDYGFEVYATQGFNAPDGKVYAISWVGLPDIDYPTDIYDYQGTMSLVKELSIKNGKLYQYPVQALTSLRTNQKKLADVSQTNNTYELDISIAPNKEVEFVLFADNQGQGLTITVDTKNGNLTVDRSQAGQQYALEFGQIRHCEIEQDLTHLNIFIDKSIFEIFINNGEKVMTGRVFPNKDQSQIIIKKGQISGSYFELKY